jgi:hypothetical protein
MSGNFVLSHYWVKRLQALGEARKDYPLRQCKPHYLTKRLI